MELRLAPSESAFDYFTSTRSNLERHGKPMTFYSDKASIFPLATSDTRQRAGITQFGRALAELDGDVLYATTPQAKGWVERAHHTLHDRLVKERRPRQGAHVCRAYAGSTLPVAHFGPGHGHHGRTAGGALAPRAGSPR